MMQVLKALKARLVPKEMQVLKAVCNFVSRRCVISPELVGAARQAQPAKPPHLSAKILIPRLCTAVFGGKRERWRANSSMMSAADLPKVRVEYDISKPVLTLDCASAVKPHLFPILRA